MPASARIDCRNLVEMLSAGSAGADSFLAGIKVLPVGSSLAGHVTCPDWRRAVGTRA